MFGYSKLMKRVFREDCYSIGIRRKNEENGLLFEGNYSPFWIIPISKKFWYADPIVFRHGDKDYLFCEIFDRKSERGCIGVTEFEGEKTKSPRIVLDIGSHLSYPCIFEKDNTIYMIPETTTKRTVELYRAIEFPEKWEYVCELLHGGEYADTTVCLGKDIDLMLTFEQYQGDGSITKVKIYDATNIEHGIVEEIPSPQFEYNDHCRGGGAFFEHKDICYRPAQICTPDYGYALNFYNVMVQNKCYNETVISAVYPENIQITDKMKIKGIHTYAVTGEYEIIDIKFNDLRVEYQIRRIWRYISRRLKR